MKKIIALTTLIALSSTAFAQGFVDPNQPKAPKAEQHQKHKKGSKHDNGFFFDDTNAVKTVKDAQNAQDHALFVLEGQIIKQVGKDDFIFKDSTGEVEIEVAKHAWNGQQITPQDTIQIKGKVDKEWNKTELEVKQVVKK